MKFTELVKASRSYRRFEQERRISHETLCDLVDLTRYAPSGSNKQPVKYLLASTPEDCEAVFPHLAWAGYLDWWKGPSEGERPTGYVVLLLDTEIANDAGVDQGIFAQTILLGAAERGIGGCMLGSIRKDELARACSIPSRYKILLVVALGYSAETVEIEDVGADGSIRYYRDDADVHHVPKRTLDYLIVRFG